MKLIRNKVLISGIVVIFVILVPSFIFSLYQYSTIGKEEQVIDDVYENQLDAILLSINQYSTDILTVWVNELDQAIDRDSVLNEALFGDFIRTRNQVVAFYLENVKNRQDEFNWRSPGTDGKIMNSIRAYVDKNQSVLDKLEGFLNSNYQQILGFEIADEKNLTGFIFLIRKPDQSTYAGVIVVNANRFIREIMSPKIQEVAEDKMNIVVYKNTPEDVIYTNSDNASPDIRKSKPLWLLPDYYAGIEIAGKTLSGLVKRRTQTIILLIVLFNLIVIAGVWFLYRNLRRELELARIKSDFVSNVSHEIRTPLAMISMFTETLKMGRVKDENRKQEYYNVIFQETNRLTGIVNNLLNFAKIENNKRNYEFSESSLNEVIRDILYAYKFDLEQKGFTYDVQLDENLRNIRIDKSAVTDAVVNLLSNAIKYSDKVRDIKITTGTDKQGQYIGIADHGIGIPENDRKHVFEKFYRVTTGDLAHHAQGSGLGLSIVQHIMDAHHGKIELKSKINEGTRVKLIFPVRQHNEQKQ